ncbi:Na+/H+ antiporter NhaA [Campylobacter sp. faydin G-24]|uniref:Na(+)/H(+) antiporter NhaA n=1 Tax=Campylobacter anatolicus TaxID=2829105 RepID=A0ABS5HI76_9BACT|nr:Na+/H+ antiporter NhaA [Campylobacter anatolicus]MBR8463976.1 Na+/H+ antiporter NhaA [Campylobacter anatolicus]MBR8465837.1 Na+/H+ antiporter NhaA [Campylobacter anatolicus]
MRNILFKKFIQSEASGGILLIAAAIIAMLFQNGFLSSFYNSFLRIDVGFKFGELLIQKPLILWVNDGLMSIFFFMLGLELKRELIEGEMRNPAQIVLPLVAAIGGIIVPALVFYLFNHTDSFAAKGWAIPTATDTAFALGIIMILGRRVPASLKIFLVTLSIIDDVCAILIMAIFYSGHLSFVSFGVAGLAMFGLLLLNLLNINKKSFYFVLGVILWVSVLKSGVHATLAGVIAALFIPLKCKNSDRSLLKEVEHDIHGYITYFVLPVFAFVNAGISLNGIGLEQLTHPVSLGIILGLVVGKQIGVFGLCYITIKLGYARLPKYCTWASFYGICVITGIGFTMSLFINSLAYHDTAQFAYADKLAVLIASLISGVLGYIVLYYAGRHRIMKCVE